MIETWKQIDNTLYYVSNFGRFKKKNPKNGYRFIKPFKEHNKYVIKVNGKCMTCSRLVANAFIKHLTSDDCVYHKNKMEWDNYYRNLLVLSKQELGKRTGHVSRSKSVVQVEGGEIVKMFRSTREAGRKLYISYQTVLDYCKGRVKKPMYNLMFEDDYFDKVLPAFSWEHKRGRPKKYR